MKELKSLKTEREELSPSFWILVGAILLLSGVGLSWVTYGQVLAEMLTSNSAQGWINLISPERWIWQMIKGAGGGILSLLPMVVMVAGVFCLAKGLKMRKVAARVLDDKKAEIGSEVGGAMTVGLVAKKEERDEDDEPSSLKIEEMRDLQKLKLRRMLVVCGLTGLGVVLCLVLDLLWMFLDRNNGPYGGVGPFVYGLLGFALVVVPLSMVVGILTIVQLKTAKAYGIEISWGQATLLTLSLIACFLPIVAAGIVMVIVPMF